MNTEYALIGRGQKPLHSTRALTELRMTRMTRKSGPYAVYMKYSLESFCFSWFLGVIRHQVILNHVREILSRDWFDFGYLNSFNTNNTNLNM